MINNCLTWAFILICVNVQSMQNDSSQEMTCIKNHIFNKNPKEIYSIACIKYRIDRKKGLCGYYAENCLYATENFYTAGDKTPTFNIHRDTLGIMEIRDTLPGDDNVPLVAMVYCWNSALRQLSLHIDNGAFGDRKSIRVNPDLLTASNIAFVLQGSKLQDSYFYYPGMPESE